MKLRVPRHLGWPQLTIKWSIDPWSNSCAFGKARYCASPHFAIVAVQGCNDVPEGLPVSTQTGKTNS